MPTPTPTTKPDPAPAAPAQPPRATAGQLHDYLQEIGAGQDRLAVLKKLGPKATAADGVSALQGAKLSHRYLERAIAFRDSNGNPAPEPAKAWEEKPAKSAANKSARTNEANTFGGRAPKGVR